MTTNDINININVVTKPGSVQPKKKKEKRKKKFFVRKKELKQDLLQRTLLAENLAASADADSFATFSKKTNKLPSFIPSKKDLHKYINSVIKGSESKNVGKVKRIGEEFKKLSVSKNKKQKNDNYNEDTVTKKVDDTNASNNIDDEEDIVSEPNKHKKYKNSSPSGKVSSLFGNNPEIRKFDHRRVKPIVEEVFSGTKFNELPIHPHSIKNLADIFNITELTNVQQKSIPLLLSGCDALIRSQTGSGKTLTYSLPIVEALQAIRPKLIRSNGVRALIVVPTRELALQTYEQFVKLVKPFTWIVPGYLVGGEKRKAEKARIRRGITVLIGTPGRLLDHIEHTASLHLGKVKFLVLDEADRMLDMGYERDVKSLIEAIQSHKNNSSYDPIALLKNKIKKFSDDEGADDNTTTANDEDNNKINKIVTIDEFEKRKLQTILLSATLSPGVQKLAGLTLTDPKYIDASESLPLPNTTNQQQNTSFEQSTTTVDEQQFVIPASVMQSYTVVPPKLRLVTLSSYIIDKTVSASSDCKILIFMATQDMVDFHIELLQLMLVSEENDTDIDIDSDVESESEKESELKRIHNKSVGANVNDRVTDKNSKNLNNDDSNDNVAKGLDKVQFFKLHGSMTQKERTDVFKIFRTSKTGVLLCTDVAARGLDLPKVDCVIQYTAPTSTADYVHRVGRTARVGAKGEAIIFLSPFEMEFVRMLENCRIRLRQRKTDLSNLLMVLNDEDQTANENTAATILQQRYETAILENKRLKDLACKAYSSWVRFYSTYPKDMRACFNMKDVHLGHYAKSFALRDPPSAIGGRSHKFAQKDGKQFNRKRAPDTRDKRHDGNEKSFQGRTKRLIVSEFDSGLEPIKKKKKK